MSLTKENVEDQVVDLLFDDGYAILRPGRTLDLDCRFSDDLYYWDDVTVQEFIVDLEARFDIEVSWSEAEAWQTIGDIVETVWKLLSE